MVGKIKSGPSIRGALNYNENKVKEGKAKLIGANAYHKAAQNLRFSEKLNRLLRQADLNERVKHKCIHISVNFDPSEKFSNSKLLEIGGEYMQEIGLGEQPYLIYRHTDTAHPHIHIVTTTIFPDGKQKNLHNLGRKESFQACRKIEKARGLVSADKVAEKTAQLISPAGLSKATYSESETKSEIGRVLFAVLSYYHFSNIRELNTLLQQYNVYADTGVSGSRMEKNNGLVYYLLKNRSRTGVAIKSSKYHFKAQLKDLKELFKKGETAKEELKGDLKERIDSVLHESRNIVEFQELFNSKDVKVIFRINDSGQYYGITFIDELNHCIFNGSDIGKGYSCRKIMERIEKPYIYEAKCEEFNRQFTEKVVSDTHFTGGYRKVISEWIAKGLYIYAESQSAKRPAYRYGHFRLPKCSFVAVPSNISAYLNANNYLEKSAIRIKSFLDQYASSFSDPLHYPISHVANVVIPFPTVIPLIDILFQSTNYDPVDSHWLRETKNKKKRPRPS